MRSHDCYSTHKRTAEEIKKKWSTYTSTVKKQAAFVRRKANMTSGGPSPDGLTPLQDKVVGIIGDTQIDGIAGGIDTCQASDSPMDQMREEFESSFETALPAISGTSSAGDDKSLFTQTRSSPHTESSKETLVEIERERLAVEKDRLTIEKERLATEKPGLEIERKSLLIKEQKYQLYMTKLNLNLQQIGISVNSVHVPPSSDTSSIQ
ncbi:unnamed protein product [Mytilus coruscus]|uniref:Nuclear apoptosis-inducing factor 1 n=1 Tax=Mytilus coruscus TaxID=42192 RepID=A0A6J8C3L1_MYTCO|nr:unnamed protein product [Mytilus coruscus]